MATNEKGPASPAPDLEVSLEALLDQTAAAVLRHVVMPMPIADVVALWVGHTWVYLVFDYTPRLGITAPERGCGKSTLMDLLNSVCCNPKKSDNLTPAVAFRTIDAAKGRITMLADEFDTYLRQDRVLQGILNSGYERSGSAPRCEKDDKGNITPKEFSTFAPLALAGIGKLPGPLASRSIPVALQKRTRDEPIEKFRHNGNRAKLKVLQEEWARWAQKHGIELRGSDPPIPEELDDRQGDICVPLLALAQLAGPSWYQRACDGLLAAFGNKDILGGGDTFRVRLLRDIKAVLEPKDRHGKALPVIQRAASQELCNELSYIEDAPWRTLDNGRPITQSKLASILDVFRIYPKTIWWKEGDLRPAKSASSKGYERQAFVDAWNRYLEEEEGPPPGVDRGSAAI